MATYIQFLYTAPEKSIRRLPNVKFMPQLAENNSIHNYKIISVYVMVNRLGCISSLENFITI